MNVDALTLLAYADKSQQRERELWKRFLGLLLPILLEVDADEIKELFDEAACDDIETVLATVENARTAPELARVISATLGLALGLPAEFGLSAFVECNPPTRIHAQRTKALRLTDQDLMGRWLGRFTRIQADDDFLRMAADWKERLHALLKGESFGEDAAVGEGRVEQPDETHGEDVDEALESIHVSRGRRRKSA